MSEGRKQGGTRVRTRWNRTRATDDAHTRTGVQARTTRRKGRRPQRPRARRGEGRRGEEGGEGEERERPRGRQGWPRQGAAGGAGRGDPQECGMGVLRHRGGAAPIERWGGWAGPRPRACILGVACSGRRSGRGLLRSHRPAVPSATILLSAGISFMVPSRIFRGRGRNGCSSS